MTLDLNALGLQDSDEEVPLDFADMAEQPGGGRKPIPQPGTYKFKLPPSLDDPKIYESISTKRGKRLRVRFAGPNALLILPTNVQFETSVTNAEREIRGKFGSDLAWLLQKLGFTGSLKMLSDYAKAISAMAGKEFVADVEWSASCNPKREIYKDGKKQEGTMGCGQEFRMDAYTRRDGRKVLALPKLEDGTWADEIVCPSCEADIRVFANLARFQGV